MVTYDYRTPEKLQSYILLEAVIHTAQSRVPGQL